MLNPEFRPTSAVSSFMLLGLTALTMAFTIAGCGSYDDPGAKSEQVTGACYASNSGLVNSPINNPYLYEVSKGGRTSYLLGTIHLGVSLDELPAHVTTLIDRVDSLVVEVVLPQPQAEKMLRPNSIENAAVNERLMNPRSSPFSALEQRKLLCHGIPAAVVENMSDDDCRTVIFAPLLFPKLTFLDVEIMLRAHRRGIPLVALDTDKILADAKRLHPSESDLGACSVKRDLLAHDPAVFRQMSVDLTADYREGTKDFDGDAQVDYRNRAWMPEVVRQMSSRSVFMAVGAAHLSGHDGVIKLLEGQGFQVRRIR